MTHRRPLALVALCITVFIGSHATVARAYEPCDDQQVNRCVQVATVEKDLLHPASSVAPIGVAPDDLTPLRGHEQAMGWIRVSVAPDDLAPLRGHEQAMGSLTAANP